MKKLILFIAIFVFAIGDLISGGGFKNTEISYYYKSINSNMFIVYDESPKISDSFYVAISYSAGVDWEPITEKTAWGNEYPVNKEIQFNVDTVLSGVQFGLFVNPNFPGGWQTTPINTFTTDFITSSGTFTHVPTVLFD